MPRPPLETDRLRIRPFRPAEDAAALAAVYSDAEVMRYVTGGPLAPDRVEAVLARHVADNAGDLGFYAVEERETGTVVGEVGFGVFETGEPEVGWTFARAYWGRGYAGEAVRALLAAREGALVATVDSENERSLRLAERVGLRRRESRVLHGRPHVIFER